MNQRRFSKTLALVSLAFVLAVSGCGGSKDEAVDTPPSQPTLPTGSATVGGDSQTAAVTIQGIGGASVVIPPGAAAQAVTVRIAADSTGSPALPADLVPQGPMLAITPHDLSFSEPVRIRIPAPAVTLAEGERLVLAKASPQGEWVVMSDTQLVDGMLELDVTSFSYFLPILIRGGTANLQPWAGQLSVSCGNQDCRRLVGPVDVTVRLTTNNGVLPAGCPSRWNVDVETRTRSVRSTSFSTRGFPFGLPVTGGTTVRSWNANTTGMFEGELSARLTCPGLAPRYLGWASLKWLRVPSGGVDVLPVALAVPTLTGGGTAVATATFTGGGQDGIEGSSSFSVQSYPVAPTVANQATVDWERSDDDGASWRFVATSYQTMANASPFGSNAVPWDYWTVRHEFGSEGNRSGRILFRVRACVDARVSADGRTFTTQRRCRFGEAGTGQVVAASSPLVFTQQPRAVLVLNGQTATLTAAATGLPLPDVSWQTRPANSAGAWTAITPGSVTGTSSSSYTTGPLTLADNGTQFRARAFVNGNEEFSAPVTVSVSDAPVAPQFTLQPSAIRTVSGGDATFAVAVRGTEPLSYQWRVNGQVVLGENASAITLQAVRGTASVSVEVSNGAGSITSREVSVTAFEGPIPGSPLTILTQPVATTVGVGHTATLAVQAQGRGTLRYQWVRGGAAVPGAADAPILTFPNASAADAGNYQAIVSNEAGDVARSAEVALVVSANGSTATPPAITVQPVGLSAEPGQTALFAVGASGSGTLGYQWYREGVAITGATQPVLTLTALAAADAANYSVTVSNAQGSVSSNAAGLVVLPAPGAPLLGMQTFAVSAIPGGSARISIGVSGTPAPQCLWLRNGVLINGATDCTGYTVANASLADNGHVFTWVAYNSAGAVVGGPAVLTVQAAAAPAILSQPADVATSAGGVAVFSSTFSGNPQPDRRWFVNGVELPVAYLVPFTAGNCSGFYEVTGASLALYQLAAGCDGTTVYFMATNSLGNATSATARISFTPAVPTNALTATQIVAGLEWSLVLRPDRSVWAWGRMHRTDGTVQYSNLLAANLAMRPVRMYPSVLTDVRAISGWAHAFWALKGDPGTTSSRVLHWGRADAGSDGRGGDGNGSVGSSISPRNNEAAPVEVLERVGGVARPVDRVCAIAGGGEQLAMIRAIDSAGATTNCNAGSAKTVWFVGSLQARGYESTGLAFAMPGLPTDSPPAAIFTGQTTSGSPGLVIALEDGRSFGLGQNPYGGFGIAATGSGIIGGLAGPALLPSTWGSPRSFGMSFYYSLFVVRADGSVMTSGYDSNGELGLGSVIGGSTLGPRPVLAETCTGLPCADVLTGVTAIAGTTTGATLALKNGQILAWGARDSNGLRGPGVTANQPLPRSVASTVTGFSALSASNTHALVIGPGNVVYAWGSGLRGALGDGVDGNTRTAPEMVTTP